MDASLELLKAFQDEALGHLDSLEGYLLDEETAYDDPEVIKSMFISIHTVKGGSAMLDMKAAWLLSHAMEDVVFECREGASFPEPEVASLLLQGSGILRGLIAGSTRAAPDSTVEHLAAELRSRLKQPAREAIAPAVGRVRATPRPIRTWRGLVVDESPTVRMVHGMVLKDAGYQVDAVADGQDALRRIRGTDYDILVAGARAKSLGGLELVAEARRERPAEQLAIILSGQADPDDQPPPELAVEGRVAAGVEGQQQLLQLARSIKERQGVTC